MSFAPVTVREEATAKINLSLDVIDRRDDGYHTIDSVMQAISLADGVTVTVAPFSCTENRYSADSCQDNPDHSSGDSALINSVPYQESSIAIELQSSIAIAPVETNTAVRAARLWCRYTAAANLKIRIYLQKNIPVGAGLGGGSSDAAAVLRSLNRLAREERIGVAPLSAEILLEIAAAIGADVPFCLYGGIARCRGIGEIVEPLEPLPQWPLILALPPFSFSTAARYKELDQLDKSLWQQPDTEALLQAINSHDIAGINQTAFNVFSNIPDENVTSLQQALLETDAEMVRMTGSGPVVFALYTSEEERDLSLQMLKDPAHKDTVFLPAHLIQSRSSFYFQQADLSC